MTDFRTVTQTDIETHVSYVACIYRGLGPRLWDLVYEDTLAVFTNMQERDIVDKIHGLPDMIDEAITSYSIEDYVYMTE